MHVDDALQVSYLLLQWLLCLGISPSEFEECLLLPEVVRMPLAEFDWTAVWRVDWLLEDRSFSREGVVIRYAAVSACFDVGKDYGVL